MSIITLEGIRTKKYTENRKIQKKKKYNTYSKCTNKSHIVWQTTQNTQNRISQTQF